MNSNSLISFLFILPLSLASHNRHHNHQPHAKITDAVNATCASIACAHRTIPYNFCVAAFNSEPNTIFASPRGLAMVATGLAMQRADRTKARIDDIVDNAVKTVQLKKCAQIYFDASKQLQSAWVSIDDGKIAEAKGQLAEARGARGKCKRAFRGVTGVRVPVSRADGEEYERLVEIAAAILGMVK